MIPRKKEIVKLEFIVQSHRRGGALPLPLCNAYMSAWKTHTVLTRLLYGSLEPYAPNQHISTRKIAGGALPLPYDGVSKQRDKL